MLGNLQWTDIIIALASAYFGYLGSKAAKAPDQEKLLNDRYDALYALVEKQRDSYMKVSTELESKVRVLENEVLEYNKREFVMRRLIEELTGVSFETYLADEYAAAPKGGE